VRVRVRVRVRVKFSDIAVLTLIKRGCNRSANKSNHPN
jgi:hypothetical protein